MAFKAGDAEKLMSVDLITAATTSGSAWQITKGLTISAPTIAAARYFQLPDPTTVPLGMKFEVKDGTGNSSANAITVSTSGSAKIDGSTDADVIKRNWGGKTFVSTGTDYIIAAGEVREVIAPAPAGGSVQFDFGGSDDDAIPAGWSQSQTGSWLNGNGVWTISSDAWHSSGSNSTSLHCKGDGGKVGTLSYNMMSDTTGNPGISTISYNAGTLSSGDVVSFYWIKDFVYSNVHNLYFKVNGITAATAGDEWEYVSYTIPSTANYTFEFCWVASTNAYAVRQYASNNTSMFIDLFTIS